MAKVEKSAPKKGPVVDAEKCIGCGVCVSLCPDVFELVEVDGSHKSVVKKNAKLSSCDINDAKDSCPVGAIIV